MPRTDLAAAINATIEPVATYHTDPRGWRMFARLASWGQRGISGRGARKVIDPNPAFHGPVALARPQTFAGAAALGAGTVSAPTTSEVTDERAAGVLNATHMRLFAARVRDGRR